MKCRWLSAFLLCNLCLCLCVFRDALWGSSLLAPLDILPAVASKYHFVDPNSSGIPANQFIIDQVTYDLPVQTSIYRAYRHGEIPWWDPFILSGKPLLAEAHINGTEPLRVLAYLTLPFELAYNWTRVLNYVFSGLGMFLLVWNALFLVQYRFGYIPRKDTITLEQLTIDKFRLHTLPRKYLGRD